MSSLHFRCAMNAAVLALFVSDARASLVSQVVIDFEDFNLGGAEYLDVASPLSIRNVGDSGVDVSIHQGADLRIYDLFQYNPSAVGQALIDMSWSTFMNPNGTDFLFSSPVMNFSLRAGDFGGDSDSPLRIEAFDANNFSLGVATVEWPENANLPFGTLSLNVSGIRRIHYSSGGEFTNSTFVDDVTFTPVPEPATFFSLALYLTLFARGQRRARSCRQ